MAEVVRGVGARLLQRLGGQVLTRFPGLRVDTGSGAVQFVGTFPVRANGRVLDEFQVAVTLTDAFPRSMPTVRELSGRVPHDAEHHVNQDGTLCVILPDEYWVDREECDLVHFLDGPLTNYFIGILHYLDAGAWPFGEHAHGREGVRDFYARLFGTSDGLRVSSYLDILRRRELKKHWPCPCGSGKRIARCHWQQILNLRRRVRPRLAADALRRLRDG